MREKQGELLPQEASPRRFRLLIALGLVGLILYMFSLLTFVNNLPEASSTALDSTPPSDGIAVFFLLQQFQFETDTARMLVVVDPGEGLLIESEEFETTSENGSPLVTAADIYLRMSPLIGAGGLEDAGNRTIRAGSTFPQTSGASTFLTGAAYTYPFDRYSMEVNLQAWVKAPDGSRQSIPVIAKMVAPEGLSSWRANFTYPVTAEAGMSPENASSAETATTPIALERGTWVRAELNRGQSTIQFVVIMLGMMLMIAGISTWSSLELRGKNSEGSILQVGVLMGFVFSLPGNRNSLPGAPPLGAYIDVLIFYPVMIILIFNLILFMANSLRKRVAGSKSGKGN